MDIEQAYQVYQQALCFLCFSGIAVLALGVIGYFAAIPLWKEVRRFLSLTRIQQIAVGVFVIGLIHYGATKQRISFDGGIKDNSEHRSVITNNLVDIRWERDTSQGIFVPEAASVYIDYKLHADTNAVWELLAESTVGQWHWAGIVQNATNYEYNVWAHYIPPEPVHTNGVWIYKTLRDRRNANPIPLRARIEVNGKAIATPKEKRKDEGK